MESLSDFVRQLIGKHMIQEIIAECQFKMNSIVLKGLEPSPQKANSINSRNSLDSEDEIDIGHNLQKEFEDLK
jgi:hypothetical protein